MVYGLSSGAPGGLASHLATRKTQDLGGVGGGPFSSVQLAYLIVV